MKPVNPTTPIRADHRLIKNILEKQPGDVQHIEREYNMICKVFRKSGGSWLKLFKGDPDSIVLLKKICKSAVKNGFVTSGGFPTRSGEPPQKG